MPLDNVFGFQKKMCFNNIWSRMDIRLYGLCVGISKETEAMPDKPVQEQNRDLARGACIQQHVIFQAAV